MSIRDASQASEIELLRLNVQARLDAAKTQEERNQLGQFATPTALATDILACARSLLSDSEKVCFLDPAFGTGSFYSALGHTFPAERIIKAYGFEIDPHYGHEAQRLWRATPLMLQLTDFTRVTPPLSEHDKFNLLICNPPYVRHHHIPTAEKNRLLALVRQATGIRLNGLTGLYGYFMLLCHSWMAEGGLAGWLIPSEFMDVNYGRQIKRYLLDGVTLLRVHRFRSEEVQFDDAMVSSAVVWFRNQPPSNEHYVEFSYGGSLNAPSLVKRVSSAVLNRTAKWTGVATFDGDVTDLLTATSPLQATLGELFQIKRGIATGANDFFVVNREQVLTHGLPWEYLIPILPSPRFLDIDEVFPDEEGNPRCSHQLFLIACDLPEARVRVEQPDLWRYLQQGKEHGIDQRYLSAHRTPWYAQENRPPAPLLCTYMGRQTPGKARPFRFILNHSRATAPNVYLMLYPKPALALELTRNPTLLRSIWTALNQLPPQALIGAGRVYGGGLHKIEPAELANAPIDGIVRLSPGSIGTTGKQLALFDA